MTRLHIGNLCPSTTTATLGAALARTGRKFARVEVVASRDFGRSRGFAFVDLDAAEDTEAAVLSLQGSEVEGRAITVAIAHGPKSRFGTAPATGKPASIRPLK
jgi:RNA recognition motif-containing protein